MSKSIIIVGAGPGFSTGVARKFGAEGYSIGLISRNLSKLQAMTAELKEWGIRSVCSSADAGDARELEYALTEVKTKLGGVNVLLYNTAVLRKKDILTESMEDLAHDFRINTLHALHSVQVLHEDLKHSSGAVLLTGGGLSQHPNPLFGSLSLGKAGIRSLAYQLNARLKSEGIYAGTLTINGMVQSSSSTHSPELLASALWQLYQDRSEVEVIR